MFLGILSSIMKLTKVKQQVFLCLQDTYFIIHITLQSQNVLKRTKYNVSQFTTGGSKY